MHSHATLKRDEALPSETDWRYERDEALPSETGFVDQKKK